MSIWQHEEEILLCCVISHKMLRTDSVLDQICEVFQKTNAGPSLHLDVGKALPGVIRRDYSSRKVVKMKRNRIK